MKKFLSISLLLSLTFTGCLFKKKNQKPTITKTQTDDSSGISSEEAQEFLLEDDSEGNVFENPKQESKADEFSWEDLEENKENNGETVQFEFNKSVIRPEAKEKIKRNVKKAKEKISKEKDTKVFVKGHSCHIAKNKEYNYALSQERAYKVAKEYKKEGIPSENIKSVGYGDSMPLTDAEGMEAQSINRRAETTFVNE